MLRKTLIALTAVAALGVGSIATAAHGRWLGRSRYGPDAHADSMAPMHAQMGGRSMAMAPMHGEWGGRIPSPGTPSSTTDSTASTIGTPSSSQRASLAPGTDMTPAGSGPTGAGGTSAVTRMAIRTLTSMRTNFGGHPEGWPSNYLGA